MQQDSNLESFYCGHFEPIRLRSRSPHTKRLYRSTLRAFARFLERQPTLNDLTDETVCRYLSWCSDRGLSPYSVEKERNNVTAIWRWANRKGLVKTWPDVPPEPLPQDDPIAWQADELATLFESLRKLDGRVGDAPAWLWWTALHGTLWDTGERISAVLQCKTKIKVDPLPQAVVPPPEPEPASERVFVEAKELRVDSPFVVLERKLRNTRILAVAACLLAIAGFWLPKQQPFEMPEAITVGRLFASTVSTNGLLVSDAAGNPVGAWSGLEPDGSRLTMEHGRGKIELHVSPERGLITANGFAMNDDKGRRRGIMGTHESVAVISLFPEHDDGPQAGMIAGDGLAVVGSWQNAAAKDGATLTANANDSNATLIRYGDVAWKTPER